MPHTHTRRATGSPGSWPLLAFVLLSLAFALPPAGRAAVRTSVQVQNENLSLGFDLSQGITIDSIYDKVIGHEYLAQPTFLFEFAANNGTAYHSDAGLVVQSFALSPDGHQLSITARATQEPLTFNINITAAGGDVAAVLSTGITSQSSGSIFLRTVFPKLWYFKTAGDPTRIMGMVPSELGLVVPLQGYTGVLGKPFDIDVGLPTSMNTMELADVYDPASGAGLFVADAGGDVDRGIAPIQFTLSPTEMDGFWIANLPPGGSATVPPLAIGVHHDGDWHRAVQLLRGQARGRPAIPDRPGLVPRSGRHLCPLGIWRRRRLLEPAICQPCQWGGLDLLRGGGRSMEPGAPAGHGRGLCAARRSDRRGHAEQCAGRPLPGRGRRRPVHDLRAQRRRLERAHCAHRGRLCHAGLADRRGRA